MKLNSSHIKSFVSSAHPHKVLAISNQPDETAKIINALDIKGRFKDDPKSQGLVREAIKINTIFSNGEHSRFLSSIKKTKNYMFACLMLQFLNNSR